MLENPRWERFVQAYAQDGNAAAAYRAAGYKPTNDRSAASCANKLLINADIQRRLAELTEEARARAEKSAIADLTEIRQRVTAILRGEREDAKSADIIRAGEFLAKIGGAEPEPQPVRVELSLSGKLARLRELLDDDGD